MAGPVPGLDPGAESRPSTGLFCRWCGTAIARSPWMTATSAVMTMGVGASLGKSPLPPIPRNPSDSARPGIAEPDSRATSAVMTMGVGSRLEKMSWPPTHGEWDGFAGRPLAEPASRGTRPGMTSTEGRRLSPVRHHLRAPRFRSGNTRTWSWAGAGSRPSAGSRSRTGRAGSRGCGVRASRSRRR